MKKIFISFLLLAFSLSINAQQSRLITTVRDSHPSVSPDGKWIYESLMNKASIYSTNPLKD